MNKIDSFKGEYRFLSNFWLAEVELDGLVFPSVENAYQAAKSFTGREAFLKLTSGQAKKEGQKSQKRPDWDQVKLLIMKDLVRKKFVNNKSLGQRLLQTGDLELIEGNTWGDIVYGVCNSVGENHLGKILMEVRAELVALEEARKELAEGMA